MVSQNGNEFRMNFLLKGENAAFTHFINIHGGRASMNGRTLNWYATPLNTNLGK